MPPTFSYTGLRGPLNWYGLNREANKLCSVGTHQSPIVVNSALIHPPDPDLVLKIPDYEHGAEFRNLGTTVEVDVNGTLGYEGTTYNLRQFHFHTPSEHRIDEEHFPLEVHFVFESADSDLTVVGLPIELHPSPSRADPLLLAVFKNIEEIAKPGSTTETAPLRFKELAKHVTSNPTYRYSGSLTTPPCKEGINWILSAAPLRIDVANYLAVKKIVKFNSRYTQNTPGEINLLLNAANELN
ncbi:hypothetical protein MMC24_007474 [Lignoscripta atroalba]|nr:hypothetical protein [Lignoscripta atroalba]